MSRKVNIHEAKTQFSKLLARVEEGEEIVIARSGQPVAKLIRCMEGTNVRRPGSGKKFLKIDKSFDDPLPEDLLKLFRSGE